MAKRMESPSSINTFNQCRRKYYYQYIEKLPTLPNINLVRGNVVHSTLENFYDIDTSLFTEENYQGKLRETIQKLFLHYWQHYQPQLKALALHKDQERFYFEETMLMLLNWMNHFLLDLQEVMNYKNLPVREAFLEITPLREQEFQSEKYAVHGFVDAIHQAGEEIHLVDYKTNAAFEVKESIKLQLAIYSLLYLEKHGQKPSKVGVFFLRHKLKWMSVDEELLELARKEIANIHEHTSRTEDKEDYPRSISPLCKWSTGQCDFYDICRPQEERK